MPSKAIQENKPITYKQVADRYGLTIQAVKKVFRAAGWLDEHTPTLRALESGIATKRQIKDGRYGPGEQILWKLEAVEEVMTKAGHAELNQLTKDFYIRNRHQAITRLTAAAEGMAELLNIRLNSMEIDWDGALEEHIGWLIYEDIHLLMAIENGDAFRQQVEEHFNPLFDAAKRKRKINRDKIEHWQKVVENAILWVEKLQRRENPHAQQTARGKSKPGTHEHMRALQLEEQGDNERALAMYDQALRLNPERTAIYEDKGNLLLKLDRLQEALDTFAEGNRRHDNNSGDCWLGIGRTLLRLSKTEDARAAFLEGIKSCRNTTNGKTTDQEITITLAILYDYLGTSEYMLEDYDASYASHHQAIQLHPRLIYAHYGAAASALKAGDPQEAVKLLTEGITIAEEDKVTDYLSLLHHGLGTAYYHLNNLRRARTEFEEAIRQNHQSTESYRSLGHIAMDLEDYEEAARYYRAALELEPEDEQTQDNLNEALENKDKDWRHPSRWPDAIGS